jgi:hypothetical protein
MRKTIIITQILYNIKKVTLIVSSLQYEKKINKRKEKKIKIGNILKYFLKKYIKIIFFIF